MGPELTAKNLQGALPAELAAVALIDAQTCAAAGSMSLSWWNEEVRAGRAPAPAFRRPRCTRWRAAEVQAFWRAFASSDDPAVAAQVTAKATRASGVAQAKRRSRAMGD
jgi:hypothetical protein